MSKALRFTIETQTENKEVIAICHLNEKVVALDTSEVAKKLFQKNRPLFDKINSATEVVSGIVYRLETIKSKNNINRLGVKINTTNDFLETEISKFTFTSGTLKKQRRIMDNSNRLFDYDPDTLTINNSTNAFDAQNLTPDDIENSILVSEIEEIVLFQDQSIKTIMLKDFLGEKKGLYEVSYRIEFKASNKFRDYLKFVLKELNQSIKFLTSYSTSLQLPSRFDAVNSKFTDSYANSVFEALGNEGVPNIDLGSERVKSSEFGKAALSFYNGSTMLSNDVDKKLYQSIMKSILPTNLTSPALIKKTIESFSNLKNSIERQYGIATYENQKYETQIHFLKKIFQSTFSASTKTMRLDQEALGYNIFTENQTGLNSMSSAGYRDRFISEQMKYYPTMDVADESNFMTSAEKRDFSSLKNAPSFLTPANLVMGKKKITTSRGLANMNVNDVREFRITKSIAAANMKKSKFPVPSKRSSINKNVMSEFNLTIGSPKKTLLTRAVEEVIDPLVDAKHYVGSNSFFVSDNPASLLKTFRSIQDKEDKKIFAIISDVIPSRFLRQNGSIESLKELQLSNKKSKFRNLVTEKNIELSDIPPQIKSMMSKRFQKKPDVDPLQNKESRAIIDETQKNVFLIKAHTGFELGADGFPDLNRPVLEDMKDSSLGGKPMLAKAYNYEVPQLGIVKDNFMPTIYNNLLYIRD